MNEDLLPTESIDLSDKFDDAHKFDLNIEKVLEHWHPAYAIREFIANALDEHTITGTAEPTINKDSNGSWRIIDYGRGIEYKHLTQKENAEKLKHPNVIGQFGIGLKDALAVCYRHKIGVSIRSRHGDISTAMLPKVGFSDISTLHGLVRPPSNPDKVGTEVVLLGVSDDNMDEAKSFFLHYNRENSLEATKYGEVLGKSPKDGAARIYVKGLFVAEEPNFLFSYNVTNLNASLRKSLNRERTNVGRSAYSDRVKDILKECRSSTVAEPLAADLSQFTTGRMHDELSWKDVVLHACRVLQSLEKVVFVSPWQLASASVTRAQDDGYRPVVVPDDIAFALGKLTDFSGNPMFDINAFRREWNESFKFSFVSQEDLTPSERMIYRLIDEVLKLSQVNLSELEVNEIVVSETMRLNEQGSEVVGLWAPEHSRIVIKRDQLAQPALFFGTLLHEIGHASSGTQDGTMEFEEVLTQRLGVLAESALARLSRS